jgi:phosphoglycerate kinase
VAVADDWQGHGVGGRLGEPLVDRARSEGIERFSALMLADNEPMLNLIRDLGAVHDRHDGQGVVELSVDLPGAGSGDVSRLLRATARGDVQAVGHTAETKNDPELVSSLAALADVYVNDAFGTAHRAHASTEGVAHRLPHAAGRLMEREVSTLSAILEQPTRPLVAILGGAKVSDKIGVIERFLELADVVCIGGAMAFPFLAAQGHPVGASPCAESDLEPARRALVAAADSSCRLELPEDLVIAEHAEPGASGRALDGIDVPEGWIGLDIGARTAEHYAREIASAGTVFWNGPMGRFELDPFTAGTRAIANAVGATSATTVVGGGETVAAIRSFGLAERVSHLSTAGGATLELLEGRELPGVHVLLRPAQAHVAR